MQNLKTVKTTLVTLAGVSLMLMGLAACDSALQETPDSFISPENFYRNRADAEAALAGVYQTLVDGGDYGFEGKHVVLMLENLSAEVTASSSPSSTRGAFDTYTFTPDNEYPFGWWEWAYDAINRANAVIGNVPDIENMDPQVRSRIVAEARVLRALHYFYLVRLFGDVPLRRSEVKSLDSLEVAAAPASEIYTFIINDLKTAADALPLRSEFAGVDLARVSEGVARAYMAKAYLQRGGGGNLTVEPQSDDFQNAADQLRQIIDSGEYSLVSDYGSLWFDAAVNESNEETMFAVELVLYQGSTIENYLAPPEANWGAGQWTSSHGAVPFYQSYEAGDVRREATWITEFESTDGELITFNPDDVKGDNHSTDGPTLNKLIIRDPDFGFGEGYRDYILLRYADVLLMYAEALNEINQGPTAAAYEAIDQVRNRAELEGLPSGLGYEAFKDAVFNERRFELATEGKAYLDGLRFWSRFEPLVESMSGDIPDGYHTQPELKIDLQDPKNRLLPIPQRVLERNSRLEQNEGW